MDFNKDFFANNRKSLSRELSNSLILISANSLLQKSADTTYSFRQDSNFWYLTGIDEPDYILVIDTLKNSEILYIPEPNEYHKLWDGILDKKYLSEKSGIKEIKYVGELEEVIKNAKSKGLQIYCQKPLPELVEPYDFYSNPARKKLYEKIQKYENEPADIRKKLALLRQIKQPVEIDAIQYAINITKKSLDFVKNNLSSYKTEKELENAITSQFYLNQSNGHGYDPIVASGKNATTIHYTKNNSKLSSKDLVLLDVGALQGYYSADISRTWSIGDASNRQNEIHQAVLEIQNYAFTLLKPGVYLKEYQKSVENKTSDVMKKIKCSNYDEKFPHGFSHFLGLDVHDAGDYDSPLMENMVLTVEPGIYLPNEKIGVRIEDNILITKTGNRSLSDKITKDL
jgi:Xaa-Pro aminopeptidase